MLSEPLEVLSNIAELHLDVGATADVEINSPCHSAFGHHVPHRLERLDVVLLGAAIDDATRMVVHLSWSTHERAGKMVDIITTIHFVPKHIHRRCRPLSCKA